MNMHSSSRTPVPAAGFSLLELAILLMVLALIMTGILIWPEAAARL